MLQCELTRPEQLDALKQVTCFLKVQGPTFEHVCQVMGGCSVEALVHCAGRTLDVMLQGGV
jgi:hypothetical protein